ncbi:Tify domain - like 2 [Theobroma cacao]|nr:Tify domain - like 2 [Theobroma cacao]
MERDFMGLNSKESLVVVKEEVNYEGYKEIGVKSVKASGSPAQLTIFYAGTVNVYEDITPEKAQAIMYLAQNGSSVASSVAHPKVQVQTPISKPVQVDSVPANQLINTQLSSGLSSPLSVSSHNGAQSRSGSTTTDEVMACKSTGTPTTAISKMEPPKMVNTMGSVAATSMMPSVPQARKASLARFLEKRKERLVVEPDIFVLGSSIWGYECSAIQSKQEVSRLCYPGIQCMNFAAILAAGIVHFQQARRVTVIYDLALEGNLSKST